MSKKKKKDKNKVSLNIPIPVPPIYFYTVHYDWQRANTVGNELSRIRHSRLIGDPFPEHSAYENKYSEENIKNLPYDEKILMSIFGKPVKPEEISIWKAYRMGYDKAYADIKTAIGNKEIK